MDSLIEMLLVILSPFIFWAVVVVPFQIRNELRKCNTIALKIGQTIEQTNSSLAAISAQIQWRNENK